eukprot:749386-Prymnesium_polylepis.3
MPPGVSERRRRLRKHACCVPRRHTAAPPRRHHTTTPLRAAPHHHRRRGRGRTWMSSDGWEVRSERTFGIMFGMNDWPPKPGGTGGRARARSSCCRSARACRGHPARVVRCAALVVRCAVSSLGDRPVGAPGSTVITRTMSTSAITSASASTPVPGLIATPTCMPLSRMLLQMPAMSRSSAATASRWKV